MDQIAITIRPTTSDAELLTVADAMQQVIDTIEIFEQAERSIVSPHEAFVWRLAKASTNSPFTVVAVAEPRNASVDVTNHVRRVKAEVARSMRQFVETGTVAPWLAGENVVVLKRLFTRTQNGIGRTEIDLNPGDLSSNSINVISIDRAVAVAGIRTLQSLNLFEDADLPERESFGEVEGVMVAAGRYRNRPAIQVKTDLYGFVWCTLNEKVIDAFGSEHSVADVWKGKTIGVQGRLSYASGGKLKQIDVVALRKVDSAAPVNLESLLDPNFTSGLDPFEYLEKLHAGELA